MYQRCLRYLAIHAKIEPVEDSRIHTIFQRCDPMVHRCEPLLAGKNILLHLVLTINFLILNLKIVKTSLTSTKCDSTDCNLVLVVLIERTSRKCVCDKIAFGSCLNENILNMSQTQRLESLK